MLALALFLTGLILAIVEQVIARGRSILAYAVIALAIGLLIGSRIL